VKETYQTIVLDWTFVVDDGVTRKFPHHGRLNCAKCHSEMRIENTAELGNPITALYWVCDTCGWTTRTHTADHVEES